jgi:general L-amino acid transport system ATP-binding protein
MADGLLVEDAEPREFFQNPKQERIRKFLSQIL